MSEISNGKTSKLSQLQTVATAPGAGSSAAAAPAIHGATDKAGSKRPVIGRGEHKSQLASDIAHEFLLGGGRNTGAG